jgi:hypothetical protein
MLSTSGIGALHSSTLPARLRGQRTRREDLPRAHHIGRMAAAMTAEGRLLER